MCLIASFISNITGLLPNTTYYVCAYATNDAGTGYGEQVVLKTFQVATGHTMEFSRVLVIPVIGGVQQKILMHQAWLTPEVYGVLSNTVISIFYQKETPFH